MKKLVAAVISILIVLGLSGCADKVKSISKEGVAPYKLSETDQYLLQSLGLEMKTNLISFKAPKTARGLKVQAYALDDSAQWENISNLMISLGEDQGSDARLQGTFAMLINEDHSIDLNITTMGRYATKVDSPGIEGNFSANAKVVIGDFREIELNKEIPLAILVYSSGSSLRSYSLDDFFSPSVFGETDSDIERPDLVRAITLTFTDKID